MMTTGCPRVLNGVFSTAGADKPTAERYSSAQRRGAAMALCLHKTRSSCPLGTFAIGYLPGHRLHLANQGMGSMDRHTIANMGSRVEQCRRLARSTTDERAAKILLQIAEDGEADIARILAEGGQPGLSA